ncbi:hypothetical protein Tco_1013368, partial [Tanacetum coccineum]
MFVVDGLPGVVLVASAGKVGKMVFGALVVPLFAVKSFASPMITSLICYLVCVLFTVLTVMSGSVEFVTDDVDAGFVFGSIITKGCGASTVSKINSMLP